MYMRFKDYFNRIIKEDNLAGSGDVFGPGSVLPANSVDKQGDFYATGDYRIPKLLGVYSRSGKLGKKRRRRKSR